MGDIKTQNNDTVLIITRIMLAALTVAGVVGGILFGLSSGNQHETAMFTIGYRLLIFYLFPGIPMSILGLIFVAIRKDKPFIILSVINIILQILTVGAVIYLIFFMPWPA